jgi:magnesium transporter
VARHLIATQGPLVEPEPDHIAACLAEGKQGFWLDIESPDDSDYALLEQTFKFHPLAIEDIRHQNQRPKLDEYPGYVFVVLFAAVFDDDRIQIREQHLFLSTQYLVTVHLEPSEALDRLRDRIRANPELTHRTLPYLFYLVVDQLVDATFPVIEQVDNATEELEEGIVTRADPASLARLNHLKRAVIDLRKVLGAQRDVFQRLTTHTVGMEGGQEMAVYYRDVYDHLIRQYETADSLRDLLTSAMDVYLSTVSNRLNQVITRLTVFATLFLPLTFITGFFGMNFGWLVAHIAPGWTFWVVGVGIMLVTTAAQLWYYRSRGWI